MPVVDFYKLPRPVQDQFIASARGRAAPTPVLKAKATHPVLVRWLMMAGGGSVALVVLAGLGFGSLGSPMAIQPIPIAALYCALFSLIAFAVLRAIAYRRARAALPFPPGVYAFPSAVIDACRHELRVFPLLELSQVVATPGRDPALCLVFAGVSYSFPLESAERVAEAEAALAAGRAAYASAVARQDPTATAAMDPLYVSAIGSPIGPTAKLTRETPSWERAAPPIAIAAGIALGFAVLLSRNVQSDERLYRKAKERNDTSGYARYAAVGSRYRDEVTAVLLPRAELHDAEQVGTVDAVEAFAKSHPATKIPAEIQAALRKAMLRELEKAKAQGTLAALKDFAARHPQHGVQHELDDAKHAVYAAALAAYRAKAPDRDPALLAFIERLVAYVEAHGPKAEVRLRRRELRGIVRADNQVEKSKMFQGASSLPSRYFDDRHEQPREIAVGRFVASKLQEAFPTEIVSFDLGTTITDLEGPLPVPTVPTLFVDRGLEWTGTVYPVKDPRGVLVGFTFQFEASFRIPDSGKPFRFKIELWRPADLKLWKEDHDTSADKASAGGETHEGRVYESMAKDANDQFVKKTANTFFKGTGKERPVR